jgi:hypothetical protein
LHIWGGGGCGPTLHVITGGFETPPPSVGQSIRQLGEQGMYLVKGTQAGDYLTQFFTSFKAVKYVNGQDSGVFSLKMEVLIASRIKSERTIFLLVSRITSHSYTQ